MHISVSINQYEVTILVKCKVHENTSFGSNISTFPSWSVAILFSFISSRDSKTSLEQAIGMSVKHSVLNDDDCSRNMFKVIHSSCKTQLKAGNK